MSLLSRLRVASSFARHNRRAFSVAKKYTRKSNIVLLEFNGMSSCHVAYSYLANVLASKYNAQIIAYFPRPVKGVIGKFKLFCGMILSLGYFAIYRSFGVNQFLQISLTKAQAARARELSSTFLAAIHSKSDIENLSINNIWIGDLLYDSYLKQFLLPTIDPSSKTFAVFLLQFIESFVFWSDYFECNDVCALNVSHCVYDLALPLRIATKRGIDAFQASATHVYRLTKSNLFAYNDFFFFRERFAELSDTARKAGLDLASERLQRRFGGEVGVDMSYSKKTAFGEFKSKPLLAKTNKIKILVAAHCFFDSPHSYGKNLFPDFYEWLEFLGVTSEETNYDWYIKTHPDYLPGTKQIIDRFVAKYPKFRLLPADSSHMQIIAEGINFALTCYGTIGFEYAALGVPVINASINNPHIAYDFNIHPRSSREYKSLLNNLDSINFSIDNEQVLEYYFMKFIYNTSNIFYSNYQQFLNDIGGYRSQFTPAAYSYWLGEWSNEKHQKILNNLSLFVDSGDFRMDHRHFASSFSDNTNPFANLK